jgi:hypothetical protein
MTRATLPLLALALFSSLTSSGCKKDPNDMALTDLEPRAGAMQVEQSVTITGNFRTDLGYTVYFGTERAQRVSVRDESTLVAVSPTTETPGTVDVMIIADNGPAFKIFDAYTYQGSGGGNVMEHVGAGPRRTGGGGNLQY